MGIIIFYDKSNTAFKRKGPTWHRLLRLWLTLIIYLADMGISIAMLLVLALVGAAEIMDTEVTSLDVTYGIEVRALTGLLMLPCGFNRCTFITVPLYWPTPHHKSNGHIEAWSPCSLDRYNTFYRSVQICHCRDRPSDSVYNAICTH